MTWPRSVGQLPIHHYDPPNGRPNIPERGDYKAHWLDESDAPLFPFGFGLSYTTFTFTNLELPKSVGRDGQFTVRVRLTNTGARDGDEVAQLYVRPRVASAVTGKRLLAYRRVHLAAGKSEVVEFSQPATSLASLDSRDRWTLQSGEYEITLGASSAAEMSGVVPVGATSKVASRTATSP
jgi:beta-glucosidase